MNIKKHIPNSLTCCNLMSGCCAIAMTFIGSLEQALAFIIIGAVFDFFDGMVARLLGVSSPIGKELDSLADVVTFGVAPSFMLFDSITFNAFAPYCAFLMAAFSALRLAKFNLDTRQTTSFIGLPTPANALFWGSLLIAMPNEWMNSTATQIALLALMLVSCWLLVCELPMFALKFKHWGWKGNEVKWCFAAFALVVLTLTRSFTGFWVIILAYVILSCCIALFGKKQNDQPTAE